MNEINSLSYQEIKNFIEYNYPMLNETEEGKWLIKDNKQKLNVYIGKFYDSEERFVSVGYDKGLSGWGCPCESLKEVKETIDKVINNFINKTQEQISLF